MRFPALPASPPNGGSLTLVLLHVLLEEEQDTPGLTAPLTPPTATTDLGASFPVEEGVSASKVLAHNLTNISVFNNTIALSHRSEWRFIWEKLNMKEIRESKRQGANEFVKVWFSLC